MRKQRANKKGKQWLKEQMHEYRASVFLLTVCTVLVTILSLGFAYLVRYVINSATDGKDYLLWIFAALLLGILLLKIFLKTFDNFYAEKLRAKIITQLRVKMFSKILRSEYAKITGYHSGELLNRLTSDITEVAVDTVGLMPALAGMCVQCLGAIVALLTIDPLFTLIYVVCGAVFGIIAAVYRKQIKKCHKEVMQSDGEHRAFMQEGLSSVMTLKAYGAEQKTSEKSSVFAQSYYEKRMQRNLLRAGMNAVFNLLSNSGLIFAIIWSGFTILHDGANSDFGAILSVILLLMQFQQPLTSFSSVIPAYYSRMASGERLAEIDSLQEENASLTQSNDFSSIAFQDVAFSYGREDVFTNANFEIKKGEIVCLTGSSGAGKSTIFKLLLSVFTPTNGNITIATKDGESLSLSAQNRLLFAYVPQGNFLFSGTIYENLTFFCNQENLDDEKIKTALTTACAQFVYELPEGLQTVLTERGGGLSEGQLQRLAVARAILSDREILLLDEATSALDNQTEQQLLENVKQLPDKTCLIVTHRTAALEIADRVLHIENAQIIEKI